MQDIRIHIGGSNEKAFCAGLQQRLSSCSPPPFCTLRKTSPSKNRSFYPPVCGCCVSRLVVLLVQHNRSAPSPSTCRPSLNVGVLLWSRSNRFCFASPGSGGRKPPCSPIGISAQRDPRRLCHGERADDKQRPIFARGPRISR